MGFKHHELVIKCKSGVIGEWVSVGIMDKDAHSHKLKKLKTKE